MGIGTSIEVSQLYVAMFGRAPDSEGLTFWASLRDSGQSVAQLANAMFATAPARTYFPDALTNQEIIASFYVNVLGRQADAGGLEFWTAKLDADGATPGSVIAEMIGVVASYGGSDPAGIASAALFNNRSAAAQFYAEHNGSLQHSTSVLAGVTGAASTVVDARTLVVATGASGTIDAAGFSEISIGGLSGDLTLSHVGPDAGLLVRESIAKMVPHPILVYAPEWTLRVELEDASGQSDGLNVTILSAGITNAGNLSVPGIENVFIDAVDTDETPHFNRVNFVDERLTSLVVAGEVNFSFGSKINLATFDATGLSGYARIWSSPLSDRATLLGGAGDDTFWAALGGFTTDGGAGNDRIFVGADGVDLATGGSGADTFEVIRSVSKDEFATITDFTKGIGPVAGDHIDLTSLFWFMPVKWISAKMDVGPATTLDACLDAATAATNIHQNGYSNIRWFQHANDTYIVLDNSNSSTFHEAVDQFVKLVGLIDLSTLTLDMNDALG